MEDAINLIRIICVKLGVLYSLPKWRFLKRRKLIKECDIILDDFFYMNIFDQANALSSIILRFYNKSPDIISHIFIIKNIRVTEASIEMQIDSEHHSGYISYIPARSTFDIDIATGIDTPNRYKFSYDPSTNLPRNLKDIWINELCSAISDKFYTIILIISNIINNVECTDNEFVND